MNMKLECLFCHDPIAFADLNAVILGEDNSGRILTAAHEPCYTRMRAIERDRENDVNADDPMPDQKKGDSHAKSTNRSYSKGMGT